jgi:hypothetical protein
MHVAMIKVQITLRYFGDKDNGLHLAKAFFVLPFPAETMQDCSIKARCFFVEILDCCDGKSSVHGFLLGSTITLAHSFLSLTITLRSTFFKKTRRGLPH